MNQQHRHAHEQDLEFDWRGALASIPMIALFWFTGPLLLIAWLLQRWASASIWRAQDRWASLKTLAWMLPLLYIPVGIFRLQLALLWAHLHLPGDFLLWPPTFSALFARSILALPLAPVLTLILERSSPRTLNIRYMLRRPRPGEVISYQSAGQDATITPLVSAPARATPRQLEQKKEQPAVKAKPAAARSTSRARQPQARDPRPLGEVLAEEAAHRRKVGEAAAPAPHKTAGEQAAAQKKSTKAPATPQPKIDWSRVKE